VDLAADVMDLSENDLYRLELHDERGECRG
jgi:hypothetical protein